jgi:peptidoglycan-associated lipoprotein
VDKTAQAAGQRADAAYTLAKGKMGRTVVSESDTINFETAKWDLSDEAKATLTAFAERLKADNKKVFIEIVGNADRAATPTRTGSWAKSAPWRRGGSCSARAFPWSTWRRCPGARSVRPRPATTPEDLAASRRVTLRVIE